MNVIKNILELCADCEHKENCTTREIIESKTSSCPRYCGKYNCSICPECGAEMTTEGCSDEMEQYTSGRCTNCSFECCGGCI